MENPEALNPNPKSLTLNPKTLLKTSEFGLKLWAHKTELQPPHWETNKVQSSGVCFLRVKLNSKLQSLVSGLETELKTSEFSLQIWAHKTDLEDMKLQNTTDNKDHKILVSSRRHKLNFRLCSSQEGKLNVCMWTYV